MVLNFVVSFNPTQSLYKAQELEVVGNVGVVTEGTALLFITQISSGCIHPGSAKYN